jgi:hypothetical protein
MQQAQSDLEAIGGSIATLNNLSADVSAKASESAFLLEATRAAYGLSGAVEEDHVKLAQLEDSISDTSVLIERLLNNLTDDITRTSSYLSAERDNMRVLTLAVNNGDLYGKSLGGRPFSNAGVFEASASTPAGTMTPMQAVAQSQPAPVSALSGPRPLVKIKFDKPNVDFEQPVYMAVNEALHRYPNARFDLVAVNPTQGNAAQVAIESTKARRNAERVLRTLTQMGLPLERINLSYTQSPDAQTSEVHLYIR